MQRINILNIHRLGGADRAQIEAVDPAIRLTDAGGWFDGEIRDTWPAATAAATCRPAPPAAAPAPNATDCSRRPRSFSAAGPSRSICAPARRS